MDRPYAALTRPLVVGTAVALVFLLHARTPIGGAGMHRIHLLAQVLFFVPILLATAWFRWRGVFLTTLGVTALALFHERTAWRGFAWLQEAHGVHLLSYWVVAGTAGGLFEARREGQRRVEAAHAATLTALARSLELREATTGGHAERVRAYTLLLADGMGFRDPAVLATFATGAALHDIGKIGIPDSILLKEGPLTEEEWTVMKTHPVLGADLMGAIPSLAEARHLVLAHHERFDGRGYPHGRVGPEIPLGARLFAVADAFDAMTTRRTYRDAMGFQAAARALAAASGTQFDPAVVAAFLALPFEAWRHTAAAHGVALGEPEPPQVGSA